LYSPYPNPPTAPWAHDRVQFKVMPSTETIKENLISNKKELAQTTIAIVEST